MAARTRRRSIIVGGLIGVGVLLSLPLAASAAPGRLAPLIAANQPARLTAGARFTPAEVAAATGAHAVVPVYAVPKHLKKAYTLGFIHLDTTTPTFATWIIAMRDAARFYHVRYIQGDEEDQDPRLLDIYNVMRLQHPDVMGAQHPTQVLLNVTRADGVPLIGLDPVPLITGTLHLGLPDTEAGMKAGNFLGPILKQKLQTVWKGRNVIYLGMSFVPCDACEKRVLGALSALRSYVPFSAGNVIISRSAANIDQNRSFATNVLTAHPNDVFVMVGLNDEFGVGAYEAFAAANRAKDMIGATVGCDATGIGALRNSQFAGMDLGCVDANPYAEGWNWVEAAIATTQHESFKPYTIRRIVTPATVDKVYPKS